MSKQNHKQLGVFPKLPIKDIPGTKLKSDNNFDYAKVLNEKEKQFNDYEYVKKLVYHYEWISRQQINSNRDNIRKLFNLSYGVIDTEDYIKDESEYKAELDILKGESVDYDLKFFPIIPVIVNAITSELSKKYINYSAIAVNREAQNQIIEQKNQELRNLIVEPLERMFIQRVQEQGITLEEQPDVFNQQYEMFKKMPEIQQYYAKEYRLEIEKWANHQIALDDRKFNMPFLEKQFFFNKVVTDYPYMHINLMDNDYKPEILDPRYCSYLRSPHTNDISEAVMFHWFEYESPLNIINRFGTELNEEDISKLEQLHIHYKTLLTMDSNARYNLDTPGIIESTQNYLAFREIATGSVKDNKYRGEEYKERLIEVSNMYFQVPRKLGKLTIKLRGEFVLSSVIDETYKVVNKPTYDQTYSKEKTEKTLYDGEHIEWFYINELWRCIKINLSSNPNPDNSDDIWIKLEKYPIQIPQLGKKYGSLIPIHGGPTTNKYNETVSIVSKCKPWQVMYNFLWNRNEQKLKTEIGKFYAMNQNIIPMESLGEEWGRHNLLKFAMTARDTGLGVLDTSIANTGQSNLGVTGGYGQMVDLTVTSEVIEKARLAELCKNECLQVVGIPPQFLGEIGPNETKAGITQGITRGSFSIKYLFDEHFETMKRVRQTMLECAKYFAMQGNMIELTYINDQSERVLFSMNTDDLILSDLGIYVVNNLDDNIMMENIKNYVMADNTLGADVFDKLALITSKSTAEIYAKLKNLQIEKESKQQQILEQQQQQQQSLVTLQQQQLEQKLQYEAQQKQLDRESQEKIAEIRVIGQTQFSEGGGLEELNKLRTIQEKEKNIYTEKIKNLRNADIQNNQKIELDLRVNELNSMQEIEKEKLRIAREKIAADIKKSDNQLLIAKVNK